MYDCSVKTNLQRPNPLYNSFTRFFLFLAYDFFPTRHNVKSFLPVLLVLNIEFKQ